MNLYFFTLLTADAQSNNVFRNLLNIDGQTFLSMIPYLINFVILAFLLTKLMYKPVKGFLQSRTERILGQINQAKSDSDKAAELKLQYEQQLRSIEAERDSIIDEARKNAAEAGKQIVSDAKNEADELLTRAKANVALELERAQEEIRLQIIHVSSAISERFLKRAIDAKDQDRLFDETMAELEEMAWRS